VQAKQARKEVTRRTQMLTSSARENTKRLVESSQQLAKKETALARANAEYQ
jgi:hypothetical protein